MPTTLSASTNTQRKYLRQGTLNFSVGYKLQTRWGPNVGLIFSLECAGAALFAAATLAGEQTTGMVVGVLLVATAVALLLAHLGHPARAWMAVRNVRTSWISRGTLVLGGFVGLGAIYLLLRHGAGLAQTGSVAQAMRWLLLAAGAFILIYPGLILSASPAIPFWNSGLLPLLSAGNGATSGLALLIAIANLEGVADRIPSIVCVVQLWLLVILAVIVFIYIAVMLRRGAAAAESATHLLRDQVALFALGACIVGLAVPMLLAPWSLSGGSGVAAAAAVCRLAGDLAIRRAILKVGMFNPVI
jgi:formate-dependent nitrite reductase membrane component NrfD